MLIYGGFNYQTIERFTGTGKQRSYLNQQDQVQTG